MDRSRERGRPPGNLPLSAACMRRIGPLITKTKGQNHRLRQNDINEPKPHEYLRDQCFKPVTSSYSCSKEHFHHNGFLYMCNLMLLCLNRGGSRRLVCGNKALYTSTSYGWALVHVFFVKSHCVTDRRTGSYF